MPNADPAEILRSSGHRPWPLPSRSWAMFQSWRRLLFVHWRVRPDLLRPFIPAPLELDLFEGSAWLGLVPFELCDLRPRGVPPFPVVSTFPEVNVRTYVRYRGQAAVWFFSLDAASRPTVFGGRVLFGLPYHRARMSLREDGDWTVYSSRRIRGGAALEMRYRPTGPAFQSQLGSLEHFLAERYALLTVGGRGAVRIGEIQHAPWALQAAEAEIRIESLIAAAGISAVGAPTLFHFCAQQDTLLWSPRRVA